jgi:hypothetical protein
VLFDAALARLGRENAHTFVVELHGRDARQTVRMTLDAWRAPSCSTRS